MGLLVYLKGFIFRFGSVNTGILRKARNQDTELCPQIRNLKTIFIAVPICIA